MKAYSVNLRKRIVDAVHSGMPKVEAANTFRVGISSIKRYVKVAEEGRSLTPKKAPGKKRKLDESVIEASKGGSKEAYIAILRLCCAQVEAGPRLYIP